MTLSYDAMVDDLKARGVPHDKAVAAAIAQLSPEDRAAMLQAAQDEQRKEDTRREKAIEHEGDQIMQKLGFEVIKFSHPGKTKQTSGISDRLYVRQPRVVERSDGRFLRPALVVWVEFKSIRGTQRPGQRWFQELVTSAGMHYVLGGIAELRAWLKSVGLDQLETPRIAAGV